MGTEKAQVYTSFFYEKNEGIAKQDGRQDYGGRVNASFKLFDIIFLPCLLIYVWRQACRVCIINNRYTDRYSIVGQNGAYISGTTAPLR